jgi:hypothetical protein
VQLLRRAWRATIKTSALHIELSTFHSRTPTESHCVLSSKQTPTTNVTCVWQNSSAYSEPFSLPPRPSKLPRVFHTSVLLQICIKCRLEPHFCSVLRLQHTHILFHERSLLLRTCSLPPTQAPNVSVKPALSRPVLCQYLDPICIIAETVAALCSSSTWSYPNLNKVTFFQQPRLIYPLREAGGRASVVSKGSNLSCRRSLFPRQTFSRNPTLKSSQSFHQTFLSSNMAAPGTQSLKVRLPAPQSYIHVEADMLLLRSASLPVMVLLARYTISRNPTKCSR